MSRPVRALPDDEPPPGPRPAAAIRIAEAIRRAIKEGHYAPGHRLVEDELRAAFGTSRGPIREALRRLEAEGLVEIAAHRGASVRRMTREEARDVFRARAILEGGAARFAAERIGEPGSRELLLERLEESDRYASGGDGFGYAEANERFHAAVVQISRNRTMQALVSQVHVQVYAVLYVQFMSAERMAISSEQHREIATAILDGDGDRAETAMRAHIQDTGRAILALSPPLFR
jgi:DNA-binding GntR family transcriptional regulator